jgi:PKD repeat protein
MVIDDAGARALDDTLVIISEPENQAPQASFNVSCQDLVCDFDASASADPDGSILSYRWEFGDGATSSGDRVSHTFGDDGTYEVRLTVSDDREASSSTTRTVQVTNTTTPAISLSATAGKHRGDIWVDLEWGGAQGSAVDVYRDGGLLATTDNDGGYRDKTIKNSDKRIRYRVCQQDTVNCSDVVLVSR